MDKVLILEESHVLCAQVAEKIRSRTALVPLVAHTLAEATQLLDAFAGQFAAGIASLVFPGASDGASIDLLRSRQIPTIAWSSSGDAKTRSNILDKNALAYVLKRPECIDQIILLLQRLTNNCGRGVLIVDDSPSSRKLQVEALQKMHFRCYEAHSGPEALALLEKNPGIQLIITDYFMPGMNGLDLVSAIRRRYSFEKMAIIGLSAADDPLLSVRFLKRGASDYLHKPFLEEELLWRVNTNMQMMELIHKVERAAREDVLTGLANRRRFFEIAGQVWHDPALDRSTMWVALLDLDRFKSINDTYGHQAGDEALKTTAKLLRKHFGGALCVARFGGEEFCLLGQGTDAALALETFRQEVEETLTLCGEQKLRFTVSGGLVVSPRETIDAMILEADALLYQAKEAGRNRILCSSECSEPK